MKFCLIFLLLPLIFILGDEEAGGSKGDNSKMEMHAVHAVDEQANGKGAKISTRIVTDKNKDNPKNVNTYGGAAKFTGSRRKRRETHHSRHGMIVRAVVEACGHVSLSKSACISRGSVNKNHFDTYFQPAGTVTSPETCFSMCACSKSSHFALAYSERKLTCFCSKRNHGFDEIVWAGDNDKCIAHEKCKIQSHQVRCGTQGAAMVYVLKDAQTGMNWAETAGGKS